ncbi:MAG: hypothetical protein HGB26_01075 [Desulfobulbaceae bacterium]|nr:hypothetical protein [Desulfobulbaceae bacterium]
MKKFKLWIGSLISIFSTTPVVCHAFTAPSSGETGFEIYDFVTKTIMNGAIGTTIAIGMIAAAGFWVARSNIWGALSCFVAAVFFYSAEDIALAIGVLF